ncbi:hypothetical protein [Aquimarina megaterium]|uniref:hypothetical protein n=1 Tax=Aquimarina megaterium TaxID=1443666 RepID=UPI000942FB67|nr:hypothetical protein [Aquimarina megaterium]
MSSFLFAVGFPTLSICAGILLGIAGKELSGSISKGFSLCSFLFFFVGLFFLTWALAPSVKDFDPYYYYASMIGISILFTVILKFFSSHIFSISKNVEFLKATIRRFFTFMYKDAEEKQLINPEKDVDFRKIRLDLTNKAIENE